MVRLGVGVVPEEDFIVRVDNVSLSVSDVELFSSTQVVDGILRASQYFSSCLWEVFEVIVDLSTFWHCDVCDGAISVVKDFHVWCSVEGSPFYTCTCLCVQCDM